MNEYCDSGQCPAQARVTVFTRSGPLFMCGHHFRRHSAALEPLVFGAYDMLTGDPVRFRAPGWKIGVIHLLQRRVQHGCEVAAVIGLADRRCVRHCR